MILKDLNYYDDDDDDAILCFNAPSRTMTAISIVACCKSQCEMVMGGRGSHKGQRF